ncbi:Fructose dehydrogenase small subunit [Andreprevotia sp. IGB-42]|uniref:sugar dehydrogenase complex small subunit n=1 Tax=Andreprevotia sp. IGB-42 TaxID=2497473 RepID=UPI0013589A23|nr:sugar dehydrogenase complex small subunit [Andreprevotia sp. IGB-42]KAF0813371.1 Fructose dehydrogenase small subunit [Andreprevotia sp. IGB-42]
MADGELTSAASCSTVPTIEPDSSSHSSYQAQRRSLLLAVAGAAAMTMLPRWLVPIAGAQPPATAVTDDLNKFLSLSKLLTGRPQLDTTVGQRLYALLGTTDRGFAHKAAQLWQQARLLKPADAAALQMAVKNDPALSATLMSIVGAWYRGGTLGTQPGQSSRVVAYEMALGNNVVRDVVTIPSYCRAAPGYWKTNPALKPGQAVVA